ncbi:MAG: LPS export ABC transporter periplasmic protein LptC [Candidatus Nitrotoga sp.]|nr:LPS export ABC transporter periplasmic protein LptC [Candidatus Nitrotoga sp.]MDO9447336.1 LPS export ABC transporter periplasmic protein LptC [Candidatus Nitrotoga sp.]MDP1638894.1 LPS export ABC transporter periplasmic protein LptC [Candidatus Nitrotoga sp.]MDP1854942.1 LPS export ABC transporter periplasmic protein LptC [Candidatus Nitrotoga sp.]MDP3496865.1 LPS export ABC transporter periplasmic protein LptC [Candidatus Nitrotoga sp.]
MSHSVVTDRLRAWFTGLPLLLLLLLAAAYWLSQQLQPLPVIPDSSKRHDPDFIVSRFVATTFNEQGKPRFVMAAQQMLHYPDNDSTYLDAPKFTSFDSEHPPVYTYANNGMVSGKGDEIFLRDNVKIVSTASSTQREITFTTSYLHVTPDRGLAETDQPVMMVDGRNIVRAVGMKFDNKARIVKLLAQVKSEYAPDKN